MERAEAPEMPGDEDDRRGPDLAGTLHEVSNALTVVLGWLEAARARLPEGPGRNAVEIARVHARLGYVLARRGIGAEISAEESVRPAAAVARDAALGVKPEAARRGVTVEVHDDGADILVDDAPSVLQILLNLLLNAIAFSPEGGKVRLSLRTDGAVGIYVVTDEGPGIPPERTKRLFASAESTRSGGAGIGLRHCKALADAAGGDLLYVPTGVGARFELLWPVAEARSSGRQRVASLDDLEGRSILVVEDDRAVLSLIEIALQTRGARVRTVTARTELDALVAVGETFDAALVDLSPIAHDPAGTLRALRRASPGLRVVIISGTAVAAPAGTEDQVDRWVRKPFEMDEVLEALWDVKA